MSRCLVNLATYHYSGLSEHPRVVDAAVEALRKYGPTTTGVRLLNGTSDLHVRLEERLAAFLGTEDAILYTSGYVANISALSTLCSDEDVVFLDEYDHQSVVDGVRLSGARAIRSPHCDWKALAERLRTVESGPRKIIATDGIFSMDGDLPDLEQIVGLAEEYDAFVVVDEAHATGAYWPSGRGTVVHHGLSGAVDVITGSLSKGLPGAGGFAAGSRRTVDLLRYASSGYLFSGSLPPSVIAGLLAAIELLECHPEIVVQLHANAGHLRSALAGLGLDTMGSASPIIPVRMPNRETTFEFARRLHEEGVYANPVCYPAVSRDLPRLRLSVTAAHTSEDLDFASAKIAAVGTALGLVAGAPGPLAPDVARPPPSGASFP